MVRLTLTDMTEVLCLLVISTSSVGGFTVSSSPFAFNMFENFDLTRSVFEKEAEFVAHLRSFREALHRRSELAHRILNKTEEKWKVDDWSPLNPINAYNMVKSQFVDVRTNVLNMRFIADESKSIALAVRNDTAAFPEETDFTGAVNGMVLLFDTYGFDLDAAMAGNVVIKGFPTGEDVFLSGRHNLTLSDLIIMADTSYSRSWYDVAILLLRKIFSRIDEKTPKAFKDLQKNLNIMRKNLVDLNNQYVTKKMSVVGESHRVLPYVIDANLERSKKQPKAVRQNHLTTDLECQQAQDHYFRRVCNGFNMRGYPEEEGYAAPKCVLLHHGDSYLRLGPFKYEVASTEPGAYITIIHDLLTEKEMRFLVDTSKPNLSRTRKIDPDNAGQAYEFKSGKKRRIVHKTVQHWISDIEYRHREFDLNLPDDNYEYTIVHELLFKLSKRIELATRMNVTAKHGSTPYQTTNYGLAGLCEIHNDPHGYFEGVEVPESRQDLYRTGDTLATIMAWIHEDSEEPVGGATAFLVPGQEVTVWPTRGAAAFWIDVDRKGFRDPRTLHGGCPVLSRSKWILNKWIHYYDSWRNYPCGVNPQDFFPPFSKYY